MSGVQHMRSELLVRCGQASDAGLKPSNDDSLGIRIPEGPALATKGITSVIADGVSAAEAGGEAAQLCVLSFLNDFYSTPETWGVKTAGQRVLVSINRWLYGEGRRFGAEGKGYVAAMSAVVIKSHTAHLFHVGDTRVYRLRGDELEQLTRDHTNRVSKTTSYLSRALGLNLNLRVDYHNIGVRVGDVLFLSTDGVHDYLGRGEIAEALREGIDDPEAVCAGMLDAARGKDSPDNLSCQMIVIDKLGEEEGADVYRELNRLPFPPDLDPGMSFEGYRIEKLMHASSRSQLYLATEVDGGRRVVLKTPSVNFVDDAAYIDRFVMEEWVGRRLSNRHLIKMLNKASEPRFLFHVMEYVEGRSLRDWILCNAKPSVNEVVEIVEGIVIGLRAMHRKETLHGDLKPDNIMIEADGTVRIIDFGSCHVAGVREIDLPFERGLALGTECYSAPEYRLGTRPTNRADLFSLGMIAYEMLTHGQRPFGEKFAKANSPREFGALSYDPAARHNPLVTSWIDGALRRALSADPGSRQPCLSEFLADLKRPNPSYVSPADAPLLARNPLAFWKGLCGLLSLLVVVLLAVLLGG